MPQRTGVKQPLTEIFYPHKIQSPPQGAKASSPSRQGEWTTKPQPQPKQYDRQLNCIQASKRPSNQAKNTLPKHIQNRASPTAMGGIPNAFVIHRQREPVFLWRNGNEFKTNHHHHQSVACDLLPVGDTLPGFHCTQVNCSQNRYNIKDLSFACGRSRVDGPPQIAFRLVAPSSCVFAVYSGSHLNYS